MFLRLICLLNIYISLYKQTPPAARNFYAEYDKAHLEGFSQSELSTEYMKRFLHENFEIKSANTSMTNIINDVDWIIREIIMFNEFDE